MNEKKAPIYPIFFNNIQNIQAVVVGGGPIGQRKIQGLLKADISVRLISPQSTKQLQSWAKDKIIEWVPRIYREGDLHGATLVFAATNMRAVNAQIATEAAKLGLLCNVVDRPDEGNFHVPAIHRQPGLVVAVGSCGESPKRSKRVRDQIANWLSQLNVRYDDL